MTLAFSQNGNNQP